MRTYVSTHGHRITPHNLTRSATGLSQSCREKQAGLLADIRLLLAWHRGLHEIAVEERVHGESPDATRGGRGPVTPRADSRRVIQNVRARLSAPTPLCERLVACLDEMDACFDDGDEQKEASGMGCGRRAANVAEDRTFGEMGMREAARCLRSIPDDMKRLRQMVDEASEGLDRTLGEGEDSARLFGYAGSLDALADDLNVLEVVTMKLCDVEGGVTLAEVEAAEGIVGVLSMVEACVETFE